jgi:hypothetical protein
MCRPGSFAVSAALVGKAAVAPLDDDLSTKKGGQVAAFP